jgi:hypothetical protein
MNTLTTFLTRHPILTAFLLFLVTGRLRLYAQTEVPSEVDINVNVDSGDTWYSAWWVWVLGIAIFLIIIVAIVSAGRR